MSPGRVGAGEDAGEGLGGVVVYWRDPEGLARLLAAWPRREDFPLVVVDNSGDLRPEDLPPGVERLDPGRNLGFGAGANLGVQAVRRLAPTRRWVLLLNPDAAPEAGAVEKLARDCRRLRAEDPATAGVAPALVDADGATQHRWQLQPLPSALELLGQVFFLGGERGPRLEPPDGAAIEQPAAAVLALDVVSLEAELGPRLFDPGYYPAWFEDVDLARRMRGRGLRLRYAPTARFHHGRGGSVPSLGYGRFLWIYLRNLTRYLGRHHGAGWAALARASIPLAMAARLVLLPLRSPRRARGRLDAARGLVAVAAGAVSGWRLPRAWRREFTAEPAAAGVDVDA